MKITRQPPALPLKVNHLIISTMAAAVVACLGISGCTKKAEPTAAGGEATKETAAGGKKKVVIGFIAKNLTNDVFQASQVGAAEAAKELGDKYGVDVQI